MSRTDGNQKFRMRRKMLGLTQQQIADALGVSRDTVKRIEGGASPSPRFTRKALDFFSAKEARRVVYEDIFLVPVLNNSITMSAVESKEEATHAS